MKTVKDFYKKYLQPIILLGQILERLTINSECWKAYNGLIVAE